MTTLEKAQRRPTHKPRRKGPPPDAPAWRWLVLSLLVFGCVRASEGDEGVAVREAALEGLAGESSAPPSGEPELDPRVLAHMQAQESRFALDADDLEHEVVPEQGLFAEVAGLEEGGQLTVTDSALPVRFVNTADEGFEVQVLVRGDQGSMQTRKQQRPVAVYVGPRSALEMGFDLRTYVKKGMTHSGMMTVLFEGCPASGRGGCRHGAMKPVFMHGDDASKAVLVYDDATLCRAWNCGDLTGTAEIEDGDVRVLGGKPLFKVVLHEELEEPLTSTPTDDDDFSPRDPTTSTPDPTTGGAR